MVWLTMPCLMKTWSRLSSVVCGRNECRLKRVAGGGPAPPRISHRQFNKQSPGGVIGGGSIVPTPDSCKAANSIILDHSASLSLWPNVMAFDHTASAFPESDKRVKIRAVRCLSKSPG